ncbi:tetratricopeptide repeat protein [Pyxidicoccus caerfyrddinensis]|uniref:tetratricopeptide repeat protein n=1 Tax=Pyxidicoccus caerfyrddinensis TaxID=2709663 RepID=UPI0013DCE306|nr:tetratricopeptide repeat protein [Pyxidicoccus caerfyrddinensis]
MSPTSARTRKAAAPTPFTLPAALKKTLLPACLAALGLAAWDDVPLPPSWRPWVAVVQQARPHEAPVGNTAAPSVAPLADDVTPDVASPGDAEPVVARAPAVDALLPLPHTHGRRVDHLARARTLRELGDLSGSLTECRRALHDDPADTDALTQAARLARLTGQTEVAVRAYEQLGRLLPEDSDALVQQARLLVSLGRHAEAVQVGEEAVLRSPEDAEVYQVLGRAHLGAGQLSAAILRFQQAVHLEPEHGYALNNLGFAYLRAGEDAKAADVLAQAASLLPHVAYVHNNLGVAYERLGHVEEARAAYANATRLSPRYVQARVNADRVNRLARVDVARPGGLEAPAPRPEEVPAPGMP